jgi:hypothetical protein
MNLAYQSVESATIIALPAAPAFPFPLEEKDLAVRGCNVTISGAPELGSLFALLDEADIVPAPPSAVLSVLRIKISLLNKDTTVAKLLFDGLPSASGRIHGTINGSPVSAQAGFARRLRAWLGEQREAASQRDTERACRHS